MKRDAGSCLSLELQMVLTCSLLNVSLPGANADFFFPFFFLNVFVGETEEDGSTCVSAPPAHPLLDVKAPQPLFLSCFVFAGPQRPDETTCVQLVGRNASAVVPRWMRNCAERGLPLRSIWLVHLVACY